MKQFKILDKLFEAGVQVGDYIRILFEGRKAEGEVEKMSSYSAELHSEGGGMDCVFGTAADEPVVWFRLNKTIAERIMIGDRIRLGNDMEGVVSDNDALGLKLQCLDGSTYHLKSSMLDGRFWVRWLSEQPEI